MYEANNHSVKFRAEEPEGNREPGRNRLCVFRAEEHTDRFCRKNARYVRMFLVCPRLLGSLLQFPVRWMPR